MSYYNTLSNTRPDISGELYPDPGGDLMRSYGNYMFGCYGFLGFISFILLTVFWITTEHTVFHTDYGLDPTYTCGENYLGCNSAHYKNKYAEIAFIIIMIIHMLFGPVLIYLACKACHRGKAAYPYIIGNSIMIIPLWVIILVAYLEVESTCSGCATLQGSSIYKLLIFLSIFIPLLWLICLCPCCRK